MLLSNAAIKNRTTVFVLAFGIIVAGVMSYISLPLESAPDIKIPFIMITTAHPSASPQEVEDTITNEIEEKLSGLKGMKEFKSSSSEGLSQIIVEFHSDVEINDAYQRVKDKVDLAGPDLPQYLDEPLVDAFNFSSDAPIFIVSLWGEVAKERLRILAEDLQERIEQVTGVKEAGLSGVREREIRVEPDLRRLAAYRIPMSELCRAITRENTTISAGNIEMAGNKFQVRVPPEVHRKLVIEAAESHVSLNRLVSAKLSRG